MSEKSTRAETRSTLLFAETQRFEQPWLRWMMRGVLLIFVGQTLALLAFVEPDPPRVSEWAYRGLVIASFAALVLVLLVHWLLRAARLESVVRKDEIVARFVPFHASDRTFPLESIAAAGVVTYAPLGEYGGWGIRRGFGKSGWAYNVRGDKGLRLLLRDGRRLLIGTQRPEELAEVIRELQIPTLESLDF